MTDLSLVQQSVIGLNQAALDEWVEYRKEKKKPLSQLALKKSLNFLLQYQLEHQQTVVNQAIMNDWQGLHHIDHRQSTRDNTLEQDLSSTDWAK